MCGCNAYIRPFSSLTGSTLLANQETRDMMVNKNIISASGFQQGDLLSIFNWTWCVSEKKFKDAFAKIGLDVEKADIPTLVDLAKTGKDSSGDVTDRNGSVIKFSVVQVFSTINLTPEEIANANCTVQFV